VEETVAFVGAAITALGMLLPKGTFAVGASPEGIMYSFPLIMLIAGIEFSWTESPDKEPGNFGDPLGLGMYTEEMRNKELNNGRMAMISVLGIFAAEVMTGKDAMQQFGLSALPHDTASTLAGLSSTQASTKVARHFFGEPKTEEPPPPPPFDPSGQVGALAPLGYFDPLGYCKVGDEEGFRNFRAAELKHGRVAMMAALGASVQHYAQFPGFENVPTGIYAVTTAPGSYGFAALFLLSGVLELAVWTQDPNKEVGDFGDPLNLGMYDIDMRNRELNNGRFAMFAAVGIIAAELVTGLDGIDQIGLDTPQI